MPDDRIKRDSSPPTFCVLLATFDGADNLNAQLRSIEEQGVPIIDVIASDDGSRDATRQLLADWQARWKKGTFTVHSGPRCGFAENFRSLIARAALARGDFFAFADQDDIWLPRKLSTAATSLIAHAGDLPGLYCGRTVTVDAAGHPIGHSPLMARPPSFRNALVQSIAGGNTMVMNRSAISLLAEVSAKSGFVAHDWWTYLWITGAGGRVTYDPEPHVLYRQHGMNLIGSNTGLRARLSRMRRLLTGQFRSWTNQNLEGLTQCQAWLSDDNADLLRRFVAARARSPASLLCLVRSEGIYRQSQIGTVSLYASIALNRI